MRAGVTAVAEAAFQDHVWPRLESLRGLAQMRIVHGVVSHEAAFRRVLQRGQDNPVRWAHADPRTDHDLADFVRHRDAFDRVRWRHPGSRSIPPMATSQGSMTLWDSSTARPRVGQYPNPQPVNAAVCGSCCPTLGLPDWAFVGESGYCLSREWGRGRGRVARARLLGPA